MSAIRALLLAASQNKWLRERASRYSFVRKSVSRFMPGETLDDALRAARELELRKIGTVLTHLGENVIDLNEAEQVTAHYLQLLEKIKAEKLQTEISVKLTQLGLDLSAEVCEQNLRRLLAAENSDRTLWLDMEASGYGDATLRIQRKLAAGFPNAGVFLQAYLHRTQRDMHLLLPLSPSTRLRAGAGGRRMALPRANRLWKFLVSVVRPAASRTAREFVATGAQSGRRLSVVGDRSACYQFEEATARARSCAALATSIWILQEFK